MATLAAGGRITLAHVSDELGRLAAKGDRVAPRADVSAIVNEQALSQLDRFDRVQLEDVLAVCLASKSLSDAGRQLFALSRRTKATANDADRLRKYLARFGLDFSAIAARGRPND
jgi:transcriptional regulatory protein RtcR